MKKIILLLLSLALLAGCQAAPAPETPQDKQAVTVVLPTAAEPEAGFDPILGWGAGEHVHEPLIQSTLTVTNPDLTIGYDLATGMETSPDAMTWTVKIRDGVRFTDGKPLTAADVAFTYNAARDASSVTDLTMLGRAEAVDDTTVAFHLKKPFSVWPYTMATVGIVPEGSYDPAAYGSSPVGSGRYILRQWDRGQQVILEANPDYYGETPRMERVVILFMEEDAAFLAVQAGQADLAYTSAPYSDQRVDGFSLLSVQTVDNRGINLPLNGFTADPLVRHAISLGLDRQTMIGHVLNGYGTPAYSVSDGLPWTRTGEVPDAPEAAANALLDEAGWLPGADGIREKWSFGRAELTIHYPAGDSLRQGLAAELASQLGELGIQASPNGVDWDTIYGEAYRTPTIWGWGAHTPMDMYSIYHSGNVYGYSSGAVDAWMDEALACTDLETSYVLWQRAQEEIARDVPWVWLVNVDHLYWVRGGLHVAEQKIHPHGHGWSIVNNVDAWEWAM
ncbi:ABC transporter substrate-binding protein [Colidextribacter sp. OB.20]|uniref:ABC transporter substrate-binding protein n=1 Tax=Colidextribacter sp. OB.20 TaxID=2304568 RepID=UPI00137226D1|nr:ABC transporter substrate-binding protein [Colidextribacter sp. OB.20]NBI08466.1 ABC transporter substrate-binding protein [Colidextribacter sp. OB.20]